MVEVVVPGIGNGSILTAMLLQLILLYCHKYSTSCCSIIILLSCHNIHDCEISQSAILGLQITNCELLEGMHSP